MVKAIFLDFDGTLYSHSTNKIPESTIEALNIAHDKGIKIYLCTGRSLYETRYFDLTPIKFDGYVVTNGEIAYDANKNIIYDYPLDGELKDRMLKIFNDKTIPVCIITEDDNYINYVDDFVLSVQEIVSSPTPRIKEYEGEKVYMFVGYAKDATARKVLDSLKDIANITSWSDGGVDIVDKECDKANGIRRLLKILNIDIKDVMSIGDGDNDFEMLKACGIGVCMGNGKDEIKEIADYVTSDIDDNGVYNALKHYHLI